MATGAFWNLENPLEPWGYFDPSAVIDIPFDWTEWLTNISATHVSHTVTPEAPLELVASSGGPIITARIRVIAGQTPLTSKRYAVKCHIVTNKGTPPIEDERTVYLRIIER